jgi:hypothetical protein
MRWLLKNRLVGKIMDSPPVKKQTGFLLTVADNYSPAVKKQTGPAVKKQTGFLADKNQAWLL